jgi:hypothetical protein
LHQGARIDAACFYKEFQAVGKATSGFPPMPAAGTPISVLEKMHLENTLALAHGNRTHAAEMLGSACARCATRSRNTDYLQGDTHDTQAPLISTLESYLKLTTSREQAISPTWPTSTRPVTTRATSTSRGELNKAMSSWINPRTGRKPCS